ncbi:MAG: hypothetical protein IPN42_01985 [Methylococcaceae bacterium]|nr:hypothetical protein [Methylococcaceae bacterium]
MSNLLINTYNAIGLSRLVDFVKEAGSGNPEIPLEHVLLISRVLFAIVMIGFIGYFFDRTKQTVRSSIKIKR